MGIFVKAQIQDYLPKEQEIKIYKFWRYGNELG